MIRAGAGRLAIWAALLALCGVTVDGIFRHGLFQQEIWTPEGLRSLAWFSGAGAAAMAVLCVVARRYLVAIVVGAAALYTALTAGPLALGAVLLMLWSAHALGAIWLPRTNALDNLLAFAAGMAALVGVMNAAAHLPVNYPGVWLLLLAAPLLATRRIPLPALRTNHSLGEALAIAALLFVGAIHWLLALKPEVSSDGLAMHLVVPWTIAAERRWHFDTSRFAWSVMPMGGDWLFTIAYLLGGEFAARLWNVATLFVTCGFIFHASRLWLGVIPSALVTAVLLSNPLTGLVSTSLFVENAWAALVAAAFIALWRFHESREERFLYAAGLAMGAALAAKVGSAAFAVTAAVIAALERPRRKAAAVAAALMLCIGAPPYLNAWARTGNPVFPFANHIFKAPGFDTTSAFVDHRFQKPLGPWSFYDFTFGTSAYFEAQNGAWGFHMLWLVPLTLLLIRRRWSRLAWITLAAATVYFPVAFASAANLRYLYPAIPLLLIASAQGIGALPDRAQRNAIAAALALFLPLNVYFLGAGNWYHKDFILDPARFREAAEEYEEYAAPSRALVRYLNEKHPGEAVAFLEIRQFGELKARLYGNVWHTYAFDRALAKARTAREMIRVFNDHGIRFTIAPADLRPMAHTATPAGFVLARYAEVEIRHGAAALYRLSDRFTGALGWLAADEAEERRQWLAQREGEWSRTLAAAGRVYDDPAPEIFYRGEWFADRQFQQAVGGTLIYSRSAGASAAIRIQGTGFDYIHTKASNRGIAEIVIDGKTWGAVDLYARPVEWRARAGISGLAPGEHIVEIRVTGRRNPRAEDSFVDVDAVDVR